MVEKQDVGRNKKSPVLAAIISAIFPGAGFFYVGNVFKGVAYMIIFALLVVLEVHSSEYGSRVMEIIVFGFLIAGFYIFQVIESFNDARAVSIKSNDDAKLKSREEMSLSGSIAVLIMGIIFLLINFDVLT
ncbi:MAG: hypothetical protein KAT17_07605, partial [Candidatus Aminicenantes bacterium]|nr:hypothetical protein [Candidatus Aminicenantes bacterium]